jgi:hypothetical protein
MRLYPGESQIASILERFGEEPDSYEWTEQDIAVQIQNFLWCGEFEKEINPGNEYSKTLRGDKEPVCRSYGIDF